MLQLIPPVKYGFLEELLKILGKPSEVLFAMHEKESNLGNILVHEYYSVRRCECDNETILRVYKGGVEKSGKKKDMDFDSLRWNESEDKPTYHITLNAEFTPTKFDLKIDVNKNKEKFNKLISLISKYKIDNSISLL